MARARVEPAPGRHQVDTGVAELLQDADRPDAWELSVDGVPQSHVDLADPTHLDFGYVRLVGHLLDLQPSGPLRVLHLGGGACTLARYVAATRPGSPQLVVELDARLAALVRAQLGTAGFRLRVGDARDSLAELAAGSSDVIIGDAFTGARLPVRTTTVEHLRGVVRVLRPGGTYLLNVGDGGGLDFSRAQAATLAEVFGHVLLLADPGVLRGRRFGNLVLAASDDPLPEDGLRRRSAGSARLVAGADLVDWTGGARPAQDATAMGSPVPPPGLFG